MLKPQPPQALARPFEVRGLTLRNRLIVAPMCTNYAAPDGSATRQLVDYYRARGRGGAAVVTTEITFIDSLGSRGFQAQLGADSDRLVPGLSDIAEAITEGGSVAGCQLGHCGGQRGLTEPPLVSASAIAWAPGKPVPRSLETGEVEEIVAAFGAAARRAATAGFDLIEVHAAHGYLVNAFMSPALNTREDHYGGSLTARCRFAVEVARAIRDAIGPNRLLSFRINGDDLLPGGLGIADYQSIAQELVQAGVDLLHVSAGTYRAMVERISPMYRAEAPFAALAGAIKKVVRAPVIASDTIHDPALAERLVTEGVADFVSMARPNFADPDLPRKLLSGRAQTILPCIRCNTCVAREQGGKRAYCAVNPATGREGEAILPAAVRRRVLVVGAGPAGIECALAAAERGHTVTLAERSTLIGGQAALSARLPFKAPLRRLCAYYEDALRRASVEVKRGVEVDAASGLLAAADVVVWATGPAWKRLPAFARATVEVIDPLQALERKLPRDTQVALIGANMINSELAWHLADQGHRVTLIERLSDFAADVNVIYRLELRTRLAAAGVAVRFDSEAIILEDGRMGVREGERVEPLPATTVVASSARPRLDLPALPGAGRATYTVGECAGEFGMMAATRAGRRLAHSLEL